MQLLYLFIVTSFIFLGMSTSAGAAIPGLQPAKSWDLNGYVKYMSTVTIPDEGADVFDHLIHQRFHFEYRFNNHLRFNAGMRNRLIWGDSAKIPGYSDEIAQDSGYMDLSKNGWEGHGYVGNSQLDRLYIDWQKEDWQLRGGRFRINWGMTTVWNPNDVFNAYSIYDFDYEERPGTDAVLLSKKLGFASRFDVVYSPGDDHSLNHHSLNHDSLNSYALRYLFNVNHWDIQFIGGKARWDHFVGAGAVTDIQGAALRAEVTYFHPTQSYSTEAREQVDQVSATISSLEMDDNLGGKRNWIIKGALLYNSAPQIPDNGNTFLSLPLTAKTLSFTEFTTYLEVSVELSALSRLALSHLSYQDGSYFWGLSNDYSLTDNWQLLGVVQYFDGDSNSLFASSSHTSLFAQIKWSF